MTLKVAVCSVELLESTSSFFVLCSAGFGVFVALALLDCLVTSFGVRTVGVTTPPRFGHNGASFENHIEVRLIANFIG